MIQQCISFRTTVYVKNRTSSGDYGEPSLGSATSVMAHVDERMRTVRTADGQLIRAHATVYLPAGTTVSDGARLSIDGTDYYDVIELRTILRRNGQTNHMEVLI